MAPPTEPPARFGLPLSDRELEVLDAYRELWSYAAVALQLGISRSTVRNHLSNARAKLGVRKTGQALRDLKRD